MKDLVQRNTPLHCAIIFAICNLCSSTAAPVDTYSVTDLGTLGGTYSSALGINNRGHIVGYASLPGDTSHHAFLYDNGQMIDLGTLGGPFSCAFGINDNRETVGAADLSGGASHAFLFINGQMVDLGTLGGGESSVAYSINNSGQIVGASDFGSIQRYAFFFVNGSMAELGSLGGLRSAMKSISDVGPYGVGQMVGWSLEQNGAQRAWYIAGGSGLRLGLGVEGAANDINDKGQIVGLLHPGSAQQHAAFFYTNGTVLDLGTLGGISAALSINNFGLIVGSSSTNNEQHAFIYANGTMADLNDHIRDNPGWVLEQATAINDNGQIVGTGHHDGALRGFLLNPVVQRSVDLSITGVKTAQVVYDPDINGDGRIDLVAGRPAVIQVTVVATGATNADTTPVTVEIQEGGIRLSTATTTLGQLAGSSKQIDLYLTLFTTGQRDLDVIVDPANAIAESDESNNQRQIKVDIKQTRRLRLGFVGVSGCSPTDGVPTPNRCYGPLTELDDSVGFSSKFIQATYPVYDYSSALLSTTFLGDPHQGDDGIEQDILDIAAWNVLSGYDRAIGVVPADYFAYHGAQFAAAVGASICTFPRAGLATEGFWTAAAHELGHMHSLRCGIEEYCVNDPNCGFAGFLAEGFWVGQGLPIIGRTCLMGLGPYHDINSKWIDDEDYGDLFRNFLVFPGDPETLVVTAILHRDGTVDLRPWYYLAAGNPDQSLPGNYAVRIIGSSGAVLSEVNLPVDFKIHVEPLGIQDSDTAPLLVTLPYAAAAKSVQILHDGQVLTQVSLGQKLLRDAINAIPDFGFVRNADQLRKALQNDVAVLQKMIDAGAAQGALQKLSSDFRPKVQRWLIDNYTKATPVQLEKPEVLVVIDKVVEQIRSSAH